MISPMKFIPYMVVFWLCSDDDDEKRIVYDDEAISQLLNRSKEAQEEKEIAMNDYFDSFKVASYTVKEGESDVRMIRLVFVITVGSLFSF